MADSSVAADRPGPGPTPSGSTPFSITSSAPLDDVMLAMDVVDTLRHADQVVERELSSDERDRQLKERLRQIYASQGIAVPENVLDDGVAALKENRFVYEPPKAGGGRWLAMLWIRRKRWGRTVLLGLSLLIAIGVGYYALVTVPAEREFAERASELQMGLPERFAAELDRVRASARGNEPVRAAEALATQGMAAVKAGDLETGRARAAELQALRTRLDAEYQIRIVSRPDQQSGVFRVPDRNPNARNYYLIVEAVDPQGRPVTVNVTSEEDSATRAVTAWGLRVDEATFARVRADKNDDGIIQRNIVGEKRRGFLEPEYAIPPAGGAILDW